LETLRALLIQRAARLQGWPAVSAPDWGALPYPAFRNRVEGVALGLMASDPPLGAPFHSARGDAWDWASEVACASCGLIWDAAGAPLDAAILGGARFNDEEGRQPYHDRDHDLAPETPFLGTLDHAELLTRLRRLNGKLGWDHTTEFTMPVAALGTPEGRGALWCALYGGSHAILDPGAKGWEPEPFRGLFTLESSGNPHPR
jgi:hypothetical protein